jgi:predicted RNA binding protein YcfA (HicA-like mRNA interferase family)
LTGRHPPLTCREVKAALKVLGFVHDRTVGSHEHYTAMFRGRFRLVTVDCPKAPFSQMLIGNMANQAGLKKSELYDVVRTGKPPSD